MARAELGLYREVELAQAAPLPPVAKLLTELLILVHDTLLADVESNLHYP
jgi:hypothetical protein